MNTPKNYSELQWQIISTLPQYVGLLMSTAEYSGIEGSIEELKASAKAIADAKLKYSDNSLIISLLPKASSIDEVLSDIKEQQAAVIKQNQINSKKDLSNFQDLVFERIRKVKHYISSIETGLDVAQFFEWILDIAEKVAIAAIENTVFGQSADPFCEKEREIYDKIKKLLR